ncbi:transmembrane protein 135-like isoform X2 [Palaemon carinicauda]|uniref:transmembrane protein 135-like isoform X2 n=1 Tax=Palaemon carinicauda TaxID=392227 RepID=UPI0035B68186
MTVLSKTLPFSCYELGHCWEPVCSKASFEICIISFIESCKIYGVVYLLTGLLRLKKMNLERGKRLLKDYLRSSCFLCVNGFGYIGIFCILRHLFRHVNFLSASFLPGFLSAFCAILVERPERRSLLAIYVTNVASESLWNTAKEYGYARPIPQGEILVFAGAMTILGYYFRSEKPLSRMINTILQFILGLGESGYMVQSRQASVASLSGTPCTKDLSWREKLVELFRTKHATCPHERGCLLYFAKNACKGFINGFLLQLAVNVLPYLPRLIRTPSTVLKILRNHRNTEAGLFVAWFTCVFKSMCCVGRWWDGTEYPYHGALAGALSAFGMYFYSAPSLASYILWKTFEGLYENGCNAGYLPRIPGSVEFLYCLSTGYLFHTCIIDCRNLKPSYRRFLGQLTWQRL